MDLVERKCRCCGTTFMAKSADVKRGWAKSCSKSCAATLREKKTGNYKRFCEMKRAREEGTFQDAHIYWDGK